MDSFLAKYRYKLKSRRTTTLYLSLARQDHQVKCRASRFKITVTRSSSNRAYIFRALYSPCRRPPKRLKSRLRPLLWLRYISTIYGFVWRLPAAAPHLHYLWLRLAPMAVACRRPPTSPLFMASFGDEAVARRRSPHIWAIAAMFLFQIIKINVDRHQIITTSTLLTGYSFFIHSLQFSLKYKYRK